MFNRSQFGDPIKALSVGQRPQVQRRFDPRNMGFGDPLRNPGSSPVPQQRPDNLRNIIQSLMAGLKGRPNA